MRILVSRALIARVGGARLPRGVRRLEAMDRLALGAATLTATACNTVKGLGRDISSVGEAGSKATH